LAAAYYSAVKPVLALLMVIMAGASSACALRVFDAGSGRTRALQEASIRAHMEFLASDALNGRGSGTRDE
jgi:hypothetical protein